MRAGPLSQLRVAALLNRHFVPVYVSNEDYTDDGPASAEEKAERLRMFREGREAGLSVGTVHVYVLTPEGRTVDSLHVATAAKTEQLVAMLRRNVEKLNAPAGEPVLPPSRQSGAPECEEGGLVLHLAARVIRGGAWGGIPGENWVVLDRDDVRKLLPGGEATVGRQWDLDPQVARQWLLHFYPATENNDVSKDEIERQTLRGTVVSVENGVARARLDGSLRMKHNFYYRDDGNYVEASLVGYLDFEPATGTVRRLRLVTDEATYNNGTFGIAMEDYR